jgi:hypothetical protein
MMIVDSQQTFMGVLLSLLLLLLLQGWLVKLCCQLLYGRINNLS